jgi:ATP-dependent RNA helicase HrpB
VSVYPWYEALLPLARPLPLLPIDEVLSDVLASLAAASAVVLKAPPGAGKTTRVPPAILDAGILATGTILVLQPRRVAARASAARIAAERGGRVGDEIGYQVRFESRVSSRTRIAIITEGILLRRLLDDPFLPNVGAVVFDEFHERSLASDLALAMVRQVQHSVRPELKIVVMSATLEPEPIARYLGGCPTVESRGRIFPVDLRYLPHLDRRPLVDLVAEGVDRILDLTAGDCLVFLPGVVEIRQCNKRLEPLAGSRGLELLQLYGDLPAEQQDAVLQRSQRRKVILSTNVAETSLTIEGVTGVVDSGLARVLRYDDRTGLDRLELAPISRASADQRAGRAGRTQAGVCLRLWPEATHRSRPELELPEIERADLAGAVLQVLCWADPDLAAFPWFEPPSSSALDRAQRLLKWIGAANAAGVTPLGRQIATLPVHPRIGRLLVEGARRGCLEPAALAAALLSEREAFLRPERRRGERRGAATRSRSDVLDRVYAVEQFERQGAHESDLGKLNAGAAKHILRARDQLIRLAGEIVRGGETDAEPQSGDQIVTYHDDKPLLRSLLAAYPDRLARRREAGSRRGIMVGGRGVRLADEVALVDEELFLCVDVDAASGEALVRQASAVERAWLAGDLLTTCAVVEFDNTSGKVTARRRVMFDDLVLEEAPAALPSSEQIATALAEAAAARLDRVFPSDSAAVAGFRARAQCLAAWMPELRLSPLDDDQLRRLLPQLAMGRRSLAELRQAPWLEAMRGLFDWRQLQAIDREAPERIEVPSGSRIAVQYEPGRPPILAVRIQEVFGLLETPRVARGRVPLLMHLLAPNMRVAQVTDDLASFWASTYALVRKDLRARYPKHAWPEDPYTAQPQRRPGRTS